MLDVQLFAALLRALPPGCQLMLVGDANQLPPVGPGSVLQDMISLGSFPRVSWVDALLCRAVVRLGHLKNHQEGMWTCPGQEFWGSFGGRGS